MSSKQRYRCGPQAVVTGKIQAGVTAEIGDLVALSSDYVVPAETFGASGAAGTAVAQDAFHDVFLGVLIEGATNGDEATDTDCIVAVTGTYEFDVADLGADYPPGTKIGAYDAGAYLASQQVALAATVAKAIGSIARQYRDNETTVYVMIQSVVMGGGPQSPA